MAVRIGSLSLSILNNYELRTLAQRIFEAIAATPQVDPYLLSVAGRIAALLGFQREILTRAPVDACTEDLAAADALRDQAFISIKAGLRYHETRLDERARAAADVLLGIVHVHGDNLNASPYAEESTRIEELLAEFDLPVNAAHVADLRLGADVEQLRTRNAAFMALHAQRSAQHAAAADAPGLSANRSALRRELNLAAMIIESEARLEEFAWAVPLGHTINAIVLSVTPAARRRRSLAEAEDAASLPHLSPPSLTHA